EPTLISDATPDAPGRPRTRAGPRHVRDPQNTSTSPPGASVTGSRGQMRTRIVTLLQDHPEGMTPAQMQIALGVERSLTDTCQGMLRYGLVQRVGRGRYTTPA